MTALAAPGRTLHPAKFSDPILDAVAALVGDVRPLLDPFAGVGRIHELGGATIGVELEAPWAGQHPRTIRGNALALPFAPRTIPAAATSPVYGNRFSDHHNARDPSTRRSYTHDLRTMTGDRTYTLHPDNAGTLPFGPKYWRLHERAWAELARVLEPGAPFVLNVSDFYRRKTERVPVCAWHRGALAALGFTLEHTERVATARLRMGENTQRAGFEEVQLWRAP